MNNFTITSSSNILPGNFFWKKLEQNTRLSFAEYGSWAQSLLNATKDENIISVLFLKDFVNFIDDKENISNVSINYYVRDLKFDTVCNLSKLKKFMIENKKLKIASFGRVETYLCDTKSFFQSCKELLSNNEFGLINFSNK